MVERHVSGDRLSAFLDDELGEDVALELAHHVGSCHRCRDELEELRAARDALRRLPALQAPVLAAGTHIGGLGRRFRPRARLAAVTVMAGLAVLASAYAVGGQRGGVVPPTEVFLVDHVARTGGGGVPVPIVVDADGPVDDGPG